MGRIRTIKPEFFTHEELSSLSAETHLFAAGLLCYADDDGYFNANEGLIKANVFPLRETSVSIHDMLTQLVDLGYVRLGCNGTSRRYGCIVNFDIHQRVNRPTPSKIKGLEIHWEDSVSTHAQLSEASSEEGKGREGNREEEGKQKPRPLERPVNTDPGSELPLANWILEEAGVVADNGTRLVAATAIRLLAREGGTTKDAADYILAAAREAVAIGEVVNRFWFTDQKYRPAVPTKSKKQRDKDARVKAFLEAGSDD